METLTEKQEAVLKYVEDYQLSNGRSPTLREMREYFNVSSDNSILKHLNALIAKGYLKKDKSPRGGIALLKKVKERLSNNIVSVPILGFVPAGGPILTEEFIEGYMDFAAENIFKAGDSFLLRVKGDSMINAGILDGDLVLACSKKNPKLNDIVIALVDGENTVKRYCEKKGKYYLKPENDSFSDIYPENELYIQGVVTGLVRSYY